MTTEFLGFIPPELRAEVRCLRKNFNLSKLIYKEAVTQFTFQNAYLPKPIKKRFNSFLSDSIGLKWVSTPWSQAAFSYCSFPSIFEVPFLTASDWTRLSSSVYTSKPFLHPWQRTRLLLVCIFFLCSIVQMQPQGIMQERIRLDKSFWNWNLTECRTYLLGQPLVLRLGWFVGDVSGPFWCQLGQGRNHCI